MSIDLYESALKKAKENDRANRDANRTTRLSGGSASSGTVDLYESALKQAKERDKQPKKLVSTAQQRREEGGGTPAIFNAAGASRPGSVTQQITSALGRMNDRGLIDTVTSSDSWDTTGEAETALKAWESQLDTLSSQVSQQERQLESAQRQLEQERESLDLNDADAVARFNQRVDEVNAQYGEYERVFNQFDTVRNRYESGVGTYHDMLIAEGGRAQNYRDEAERLAGETEQLAAELDRYRSGDVYYDAGGSGINTAQRREQLERQIEENESEIKRLRSEADRAQWAYYSGLALNEDYAERSAPLGSQREAQIAAGESPFEAGGAIYDYINNIGNAREIRGYDAAGNEMQALGTMTDEEIGLYNYIYATQGREAAAEYLERLRETINARLGQQRYENMSGIGRALYWIPAGINQFTSGIRQLFSEEAVPTSPTQYTSQAILEGLEGRPVASTLYELGTTLSNMAPSILASALGGWALGAAGVAGSTAGRIANLAGSALLGASAGGNAYTQKINEGYLPDEARDYSTLVGLSEGALQYVLGGIEGLGGEAVRGVAAKIGALDNALGRIARSKAGKLVMNMISEGTEEGVQELLEPAFAALVLGEEYDANFEDAAYAFLLGALSAGVVDTVTDAGRAAAGKRRGVNFTFADMDGFIGENGVNYFEGCNTYAEVEARYRELARENHPDLGGDTATMAEINRQHSMARAYFQGRGETGPAAERSTDAETAAAEERSAGPDGVVRALSAPAAAVDTQTPANTQEGVQRATGRVTADGGIILPTADEPGGLVLPTAEDFERAGSPENLTGGNINGRTEQTDAVSGRDRGRLGSGRPGGQAGQLVEGAEGRPAAFEQSRTALERQNRAGYLRLEEVSTRELGVPEGTDTPTVRVLPEEEWDDELQRAAEDVYWRTGKEVEYVLGALEVYGSDGSTRRVRGVWREDGAIIIQADNMRVSAQQIAEHETYHEIAAQNPGTDYAVEERIREQFGDEEFERVVEIYIQKLHGIVDLPANADGAEFEAALARVKQEIYADAYAGINAFGAHAERFRDVTRETVEERTHGEYRGDTEEATRSTTGPPESERYSYGGRGAANADLEALDAAEEMERRDVDAETIRQETGWFRGRDGKWRFEIDDSGMEYRRDGDANLRRESGYQRLAELTDKWEASVSGGEALTESERAEMDRLEEEYGERVYEEHYLLSDFIEHSELFENYPQLRYTSLVFDELPDGTNGYYNYEDGTIHLSNELIGEPREALIHEIQHAIQRYEGFTRGASPEYWAWREYESGDLVGERLRRDYDSVFNSLSREEQNKYTRYRELDRVLNQTLLAEPGTEEASAYQRYEAEQDAIYEELYPNEWFKQLLDLERRIEDVPEEYARMYRNTAGEIEARDAESRRRLTAEERRATPPDLGDENTVFADDEIPVKARFSVDEDEDAWDETALVDAEGNRLSEQQREFFADSKVRLDSDGTYYRGWGRLLPVYHSTDNDFTVFDLGRLGENTDYNTPDEWRGAGAHVGFWFNTQDLRGKAGRRAEKVYLNIKDIYALDDLDELASVIYDYSNEGELTASESAKAFRARLEEEGYDGLLLYNDDEFGGMSFVAFYPEQIKRVTNTNPTSSEDIRFSVDEDVPVSQAISSAGTSLRQVPALFKNPNVRFGEVNIDIGGGRFDLATEYLAERGTRNLVFDPYNRGEETNRATLDYLMAGNRADTATNANVLNVIAEAPARANVILEMAKAIKPDGRAYFMVYEGDGSGVGRETSAGYQNNRKTADYVPEIEQFFDRVERRGKLITATRPKANLPRASWEVQPGNAVRYSADEEEPRPVIAKRDLKRNLLELFSVPSGTRAELGRYIEGFADRMIRSKEYTEEDRRELFDRLYDEGVMTVAADPYLANVREWLVNRRMYVNDSIKHEFGGAEDWNEFRKRAFAAGIYFTNNPQDMAPDMWQAELGEVLPGLFDSSNLDMKQFMERVVQIAEESRDERVSLAEYTQMLANENYVSEDEVLDDLEQRVDWELRTFAEKAELETKLRGRGPEGLTNSERQRVIQEERAKYWQLHKQYQEETRQRIREEKDKRHASEREARQRIDNIIREEREKYWQRRREYQQRADRRVQEERERRWAAQADARRRIDENQQEARRTYYEQLERYRAARKATDARERERRKQRAERSRQNRELRELQKRTLKQLQWLARNQRRAPEELKAAWDAVLGDIDIYAVSAANEMNYSKKYGATWRDIADMVKDFESNKEKYPNFIPSEELKRIAARVNNEKIADMDIGALQDLYKAAVGLRTEFYNRNNVINDERGRLFAEVYTESKAEINDAPGGYTGKRADRVFNLEQLTPMNVLERMAGWNKDGAWYSMARQLEKGEQDERAYVVQANRLLTDFLRENEDWVMKSDGQGKDAVWYEIEVPELLKFGMGDKPIFGDTVKVYMTPSMKVQLYLESKNYDNLRHMVGGRTFPDKKLYSEGKRAEAWEQGTKVRLAPETVRHLVENLTTEEQQLASVLERYYNQFAAERINAVSNVLYGYDRAVTRNYAPIYTDSNYNRTEIGKYDQTAEGVGNMKERVRGAKNPSYNISAYDAFERHVDQTARFVGMAIPARNWQTLLNWGDREDSMMSVITHKWGGESLDYIKNLLQDLQGGRPREEMFEISSFADKFWSNYITAIFGANPSIIIKQLGSIPLGGAYLGVENVPSPGQLAHIDRELISKYTSELDWRLMGYATPETKQLKDHPNWTQRNSFFRNVFGGGAITGMDGWAASTLWPWAENKVRREQPELEVGTQEQIDAGQSPFYRAVAAEFNTAVNRSQSMSDTMHNARIRKSSNPVLRALTMFKSDAAQTYNAFRQTIGEAQYYKKNNADTRTQSRARRAIGAAFAAWILNAAWGAAINYLINLWKRKGDNYRDEEGELTAESVLRAMVYDMVGSLSGVVVYGEELSDIIGSVFTGERWYGMEAPAIEQLNDILEALLNSGNSIRKVVDEAHNIASQGGDLGEYFSEHSGEIISGVQDIASKAAMYFAGLPASNVEAYVLGALRWLSPELVTAYEDALGEANRASLEGLEDDALVTRVRDILSQRLNEVSELTAQTVATLYTAGYSNALPSNTPSSVSVKGEDGKTAETVEFDAFKQQFYNRVWTETVGTAVDELTAMPEFEAAGPEDQVKMLRKVYDYADGMARAEVVEGYQPSNTILNAAEEIAAGASLAEWALYDVLSADVSGNFDRAVDQGLDYESALEVAEAVEDAGEGASSAEKYLAVAELPLSELDKEAALEGIMSESAYERYSAARAAGIDTYEYCSFLAEAENISGDGRQDRIWALIDGMALSRAQKDALHLAAGYKDTTLSKAPWNK